MLWAYSYKCLQHFTQRVDDKRLPGKCACFLTLIHAHYAGCPLELKVRTSNIAGAEVGEALRGRVREETGVTCSVGIAPNRMLAKVSHPAPPCFGRTFTASFPPLGASRCMLLWHHSHCGAGM